VGIKAVAIGDRIKFKVHNRVSNKWDVEETGTVLQVGDYPDEFTTVYDRNGKFVGKPIKEKYDILVGDIEIKGDPIGGTLWIYDYEVIGVIKEAG